MIEAIGAIEAVATDAIEAETIHACGAAEAIDAIEASEALGAIEAVATDAIETEKNDAI